MFPTVEPFALFRQIPFKSFNSHTAPPFLQNRKTYKSALFPLFFRWLRFHPYFPANEISFATATHPTGTLAYTTFPAPRFPWGIIPGPVKGFGNRIPYADITGRIPEVKAGCSTSEPPPDPRPAPRKHMVLKIVFRSFQGICSRYQCCPCAAGRITNGYVSLFFNLPVNGPHRHLRHHFAYVIWGEKLAFPVVPQVQIHIHFSEEVLFRFVFQSHDDDIEYLRCYLHRAEPLYTLGIFLSLASKCFCVRSVTLLKVHAIALIKSAHTCQELLE